MSLFTRNWRGQLTLRREFPEGKVIPHWLGFAYDDLMYDRCIYYPVPLNFVVRGWHLLVWRWDRIRFWRGKTYCQWLEDQQHGEQIIDAMIDGVQKEEEAP